MVFPKPIREVAFFVDCLICVTLFCPFWGKATDGKYWHTISARAGSDKRDTTFAHLTRPALKTGHYSNAAVDEGLITREQANQYEEEYK
jgi:hypothetical protein